MLKRCLRVAMLAAVVSLYTFQGGAQAQADRPAIETTKVPGTDNVYIFRNVNHQAMFIVTKAGVIATDPVAYGKPTGGAELCRGDQEGNRQADQVSNL